MRKAVGGLGLIAVIALGGCATPGPMHIFLAGAATEPMHDVAVTPGEDGAVLAHYLQAGERAVGLAYDYNTDYIWLRVLPWNQLRVVNRPARRVEANYAFGPANFDPAVNTLDLAARSADLHVLAVSDSGRTVVELTRRAVRVREIRVGNGTRRIGGLAYDQTGDRLLVLWAEGAAEVAVCDRDGAITTTVRLAEPVAATSLAYDSDRRRLFVPMPEPGWLGEFDLDGRLQRRVPVPFGPWAIDAGPRSLIRVF